MGVADGGTNVPAGGAGGAAGAAMEGAPGPVSAVTARERTLPVELSARRGVLSGVPIEGAIGRSAGARSVPAGLDLGFAEAAAAGGAGRVVIADGACAFLAGAGGNSASSDRVVAAASGWVAVGRGGLGSSAFLRAPSVLRALAAAALFGSNRGGSVGFLTWSADEVESAGPFVFESGEITPSLCAPARRAPTAIRTAIAPKKMAYRRH